MFLLVLFCFSSLSLSLLTIFFLHLLSIFLILLISSIFHFSYLLCFSSFLLTFSSFPPPSSSFFLHETMDWFKIGKGVCKVCILSTCLFNLNAEYIIRNARLDEAQGGIKIARRNINNLGYADDTILMAEIEEELKNSWWKWMNELKSLLMKVKEEHKKADLKLNIQKLRSWHLVPSFHGK